MKHKTRPTTQSTTVEIILYYLTLSCLPSPHIIYNSRNYSILLNISDCSTNYWIYNSRNYSILLNSILGTSADAIYNSRNYSILLNDDGEVRSIELSTTVEIILYYLT